MDIKYLETPALVLDADAYLYNIAKMQEIMAGSTAKLRPHYKTHKCVDIAKRQIMDGAKGITCAKLSEAEDLVAAGIGDVLIANQIVQPSKVARLAHLANRAKITICVDNLENIAQIEAAAACAGSTLYVYVEYDVGMNRCGVFSFEEAYVLAKAIDDAAHLVFAGIQAYAGQIAHEVKAEREQVAKQNEGKLQELMKYLTMRGLAPKEVSGGSTGTAEFKAKTGVYTEIQAGSYIFLDTSYGALHTPFKNALFVATTVISKNRTGVVMDAGLKSLAADQGPTKIDGYAGKQIRLSEEHSATEWENAPVAIGDMLFLIPGHCCTTVNLHDKIYVRRGDEIVDRVVVTSRGKSI